MIELPLYFTINNYTKLYQVHIYFNSSERKNFKLQVMYILNIAALMHENINALLRMCRFTFFLILDFCSSGHTFSNDLPLIFYKLAVQ